MRVTIAIDVTTQLAGEDLAAPLEETIREWFHSMNREVADVVVTDLSITTSSAKCVCGCDYPDHFKGKSLVEQVCGPLCSTCGNPKMNCNC